MTYTKLLFFFFIFIFNNLVYSQFTQTPTLSHKQKHRTLSIDSIPITKTHQLTIDNLSKFTNDYVYYFNSSIGIQNPIYGVQNINRVVINTTDGTLYGAPIYSLRRERSWDNPYGANSFAEGMFNGTLNTVFDLFKKK